MSDDDPHNESAVVCYVVAVAVLLALAALWAALAWVGLSRCAGLCL